MAKRLKTSNLRAMVRFYSTTLRKLSGRSLPPRDLVVERGIKTHSLRVELTQLAFERL